MQGNLCSTTCWNVRDLVDSFAGKTAFAEQVLINVRDRASVNVEAGVRGENRRQARPAGGLDADVHARLKNSVAVDNRIGRWIDHRAVERMSDCPHQFVRGIARQLRIRVQRDHVLDVSQQGQISSLHGEIVMRPEKQLVEIQQLSALALPGHPNAFGFVVRAMPVEEEERAFALSRIFCIQRLDEARALIGQFVLVVELLRGIRRVGEQREMHVSVAIRQEPDLKIPNCPTHLVFTSQQCGNNHHGGEFGWNAGGEIKLR